MKLGITGHQDMSRAECLWVKKEMVLFIRKSNVSEGFSSLAVGADQLFATIFSEQRLPYTAVIPCDGYEKTFENENSLASFKSQKTIANSIIVLPFPTPSEKAFYEAGKKVVELCDMLLAVWNGEVAKGLGGTGDIVRYALSLGRNIIHFNTLARTVALL